MNELIVALDRLFQDLDCSEGELREAADHKPDHPYTRRLESINSTLLYLKDLTSGLLEQLEHDGERVTAFTHQQRFILTLGYLQKAKPMPSILGVTHWSPVYPI